jgi:L-amino acid N-acyltransferase YncA
MKARFGKAEDIPILQAWNPWPKDEDWRRMAEHERLVVVEEESGEVAGYAFYSLLYCTVPFLGMIYFREESRGRGGSRILLEFLETDLRRRGYAALLSSSQTDEPEPQRWHAHMGFHSNGIIENIADDNVGEVVFRKVL